MESMTLDEARTILREEDASDLSRALTAISTVLRFHGIATPGYIRVAELIEEVEAEMRQAPTDHSNANT